MIDRPMLAHARETADEFLIRKVSSGEMTAVAAQNLAGAGFLVTVRILAGLRRDGMSADCIQESFQSRLNAARSTGDAVRADAAEFALSVWDGMQRDLAVYLGTGAGTQ